ncbi:MAG TPA: alpha/beta hydrolase [Bacteroidota bacterium]|nr:alpha/beta hydrolase [Bacteroidota bacterium]
MQLWPPGTPGIKQGDAGEYDATTPADGLTGGRPVIRLTEVSDPAITVYRPGRGIETGAAVVVFPGGGYSILALDLEGTEVCEWLTTIGVTAVLLKYRVPDPPPHRRALADAQRALSLVRFRAEAWGIDPQRTGVLGFSAGGHIAASLSCRFQDRAYSPVDDADRVSCRPDFTVLIYPAYLTGEEVRMALDPALQPSGETPPAFLVQTQDDEFDVGNSLAYYRGLVEAGVGAEMHLYATGGHGYGLRPSPLPVSGWPSRLEEWMRSIQILKPLTE